MLDANKGQPSLLSEESRAAADEPSAAEMFAYALGVVRRQVLLVVLLAVAGTVLGAFFFVKSPPKYTATAMLLVDTRKIDILQQPAVSTEMPIQSMGAMESQVALLKSDEIALAVIKKLNLLEDPRFMGTGRPGTLTTILRKVTPAFFPEPPRLTEAGRMQLALKIFQQSLTADRVGVTFVIEIDFEAKDPELAAKVANGVADAYIDEQRASEYDAARRASDWLEVRIPELRAKSEAAQRAVVEYKSAHNIVETGSGQLINDQRVAELSAKLNTARDDTLKAKARLDQLAVINSTEIPNSIAIESNEKATEDGILDKLRSQQFEIVSKEAEYSVKYGPNNPTIMSLRKQKAELQSEIMDEVKRLKETSKNDYAVMRLRETAIKNEFDAAVAQD
jgi:polysaccharide biosynthesis transport protein